MRVLFDQGTPVPLRAFLKGHVVSTAAQEGWSQLQKSDLLNAAEASGFDVFVTTDKNLRYQQNLTGRKIAVIVLAQRRAKVPVNSIMRQALSFFSPKLLS